MKTVGVIRGKTIELETSTDLPDGQAVEVGINLLAASTPAQGKPDPSQDYVMRATDELRQSIAARLGGNLDSSVEYIREDRER